MSQDLEACIIKTRNMGERAKAVAHDRPLLQWYIKKKLVLTRPLNLDEPVFMLYVCALSAALMQAELIYLHCTTLMHVNHMILIIRDYTTLYTEITR